MPLTLSALLINGCVSHSTQYKAFDMGMKNNAPCFIIPAEALLTAPLKAYPPTVMHNQRGKWEATSSPGTSGELQTFQQVSVMHVRNSLANRGVRCFPESHGGE